jgi:hypothetical protein
LLYTNQKTPPFLHISSLLIPSPSLSFQTNAGTHTMARALDEGTDFNQFFNTYLPSTTGDSLPRLKARTASFCTERSGHYDAFDQGLLVMKP